MIWYDMIWVINSLFHSIPVMSTSIYISYFPQPGQILVALYLSELKIGFN